MPFALFEVLKARFEVFDPGACARSCLSRELVLFEYANTSCVRQVAGLFLPLLACSPELAEVAMLTDCPKNRRTQRPNRWLANDRNGPASSRRRGSPGETGTVYIWLHSRLLHVVRADFSRGGGYSCPLCLPLTFVRARLLLRWHDWARTRVEAAVEDERSDGRCVCIKRLESVLSMLIVSLIACLACPSHRRPRRTGTGACLLTLLRCAGRAIADGGVMEREAIDSAGQATHLVNYNDDIESQACSCVRLSL